MLNFKYRNIQCKTLTKGKNIHGKFYSQLIVLLVQKRNIGLNKSSNSLQIATDTPHKNVAVSTTYSLSPNSFDTRFGPAAVV